MIDMPWFEEKNVVLAGCYSLITCSYIIFFGCCYIYHHIPIYSTDTHTVLHSACCSMPRAAPPEMPSNRPGDPDTVGYGSTRGISSETPGHRFRDTMIDFK